MNRISRLFFTLVYLKPTQLFFYVLRRKFPTRIVDAAVDAVAAASVNPDVALAEPIAIQNTINDAEQITFLNRTRSIDIHDIDWCPANTQRLWRYNLHYFDYLRDDGWSADIKLRVIESWIANNPQSSEPGWEPFTCSLRVVNWIFFLVRYPSYATPTVVASLYTQVMWLEKNDERHILANHYFENLKALLFASIFFSGNASTIEGASEDANVSRWMQYATRHLAQQLNEQTLADGGHYERSPQYHALMLENYLDLFNLLHGNSNLIDGELMQQVETIARAGLDWLNEIVFPDQQIPLFNDSAWGAAPHLSSLNDYASRLFGYQYTRPVYPQLINRPQTGLYGLKTHQDMLIMDCGDIGPDYQPGHTHCDFLSYELMWAGKRVVVDTGVHEYEPGQLRSHVRSTAAHNTVSVDGDEQSEIWGEFRVARRARKESADAQISGKTAAISGSYAGFYRGAYGFRPRFTHRRDISVKLVKDAFDSIIVVDKLSGKGQHLAESFIHLHPQFSLEECVEDDANSLNVIEAGELRFRIHIDPACHYKIDKGIYCPEFGEQHSIDRLVVFRQGNFPLEIRYELHRFLPISQ